MVGKMFYDAIVPNSQEIATGQCCCSQHAATSTSNLRSVLCTSRSTCKLLASCQTATLQMLQHMCWNRSLHRPDFDQRTHSLRKLAVCNLAHAMGHSILFLLQKDRRLSDHDVRKQQLLLSNTSELAPHTPTAPDLLTSATQKEPNSCASVASVLQPSDCTAFQGC